MEETIKELAYTAASDVQGTSLTAYGLQPVLFLKQIVDAAKKRLFFAQVAIDQVLPKGHKDAVFPKRAAYLGDSGVSWVESEADSDITATTLSNLDSVTITPVMKLARVAITNYSMRVSSLNLIQAAQDDLTYAIGDKLDAAVATALGDATAATSVARGAQRIYGGDATGDDSLAAGDILTTDIIAKARRYLTSSVCQYWSGGSESSSSQAKNTWLEGHVLFIAPEQEEALMKDSQFTNAAEFGGREVILNGQIARYLGIDVVVAPNTESAAASATGPDGATAAVAMHRCIMTVKKKAIALVWGLKPQLNIVPRAERSQTQIILESAYEVGMIHDDAVVHIDVADA